ncbi:RagB/SusD family nutrient uptake outer membrane protein [Flavivirga amylovorans]|uniref:RagB/SusD family nutrient uptake outer membrane protein n=1 Tax=Flavivirga amylovorans TaxID=870486 RepID=A0ABT8WZI9_9FLAO|nr:RagB/SusD family nutrient uptake outer membrane protein [Flavivirga amylovorans]MDO5987089.1 RagB/SusD family nutrient uptake outer membrane protein [Flavivirga amylovorans]
MNNIYKIVMGSVLVMICLTSCSEDELVETPRDSFSPENLFATSSGFNSSMAAIYDRVRAERSFVNKLASMQTGTDLCYGGLTHPNIQPLETYGAAVTPSFIPGSDWWDHSYQVIAWANLIIEKAQDENVSWSTPEDPATFSGEARFFRAYYHNLVVKLFGDAPIADEFYTFPKLDFVRSPKNQVLEFVRDDLIFAADNLPSDPSSVDPGRITRWVALHLLSEVYLQLGENGLAESTAQEVIDGPFQLMTDRFGPNATNPKGNVFHDLFLEDNVDYQDGNLETIWAIQNKFNVIGGQSDNNGDWTRRQMVARYERVPGMTIADSLGGRSIGRITPTEAFLNLYEAGDMRNDNINIRRDWYYNNASTIPAGKSVGDLVEISDFATTPEELQAARDVLLFPSVTKWDFGVQRFEGSPRYIGSDKDQVKYRLAETYLLLAEAQHLQGKNIEAAISINTVRNRVNATPIAAGDVDMDFILDERARELYGEKYRRLTLSRTGMLVERVRAMNLEAAAGIGDQHLYFPIPQSVIDGNPDAEFPQNSGYQ